MRKTLLFASIILSVGTFLSGCSSNETSPDKKEDGKSKQESVHKSKDSKEVSDGPLTKSGQWTTEDDGTKVTLLKINRLEKTIDLKPINMTIHNVKVFERTNLQQDEIEMIKTYFDKDITEKFHTIQIDYTIENTSDEEVMFNGIQVVTTNTKHQIESQDSMSDEKGTGEFYGLVKKEGFLVLPYFEDSVDDLNLIKIVTETVWNNKEMTKLQESETVEVPLLK
nr:hypothetical protein [Heyndrickxia oleronia]